MSKQITKERIIATLDRIQSAREKAVDYDSEIISSFATLGLKSFVEKVTELDHQKLGLEIDYLEGPRTVEDFEVVMSRFRYNIDRFGNRSERVYALQERCGISGLVEGVETLGCKTIRRWKEHEVLRLIDSDLELMRQDKAPLFELWADYAVLNQLGVYQHAEDYWQASSFDIVSAALPFYDWVKVWENISYSSPNRLRSKGFDEVRAQPVYPDDKKRWEVHFCLGTGTNTDSPDTSSIWFCAANSTPSN